MVSVAENVSPRYNFSTCFFFQWEMTMMFEKIDPRIRVITVFFGTSILGIAIILSYVAIPMAFFSMVKTTTGIINVWIVFIFVLGVIFSLAHISLILRSLKPVSEFLHRPDPKRGDRAMRAIITAPAVIAGLSVITWPAGSFLIVFFLSRIAPIPMTEGILIVMAGVCSGFFVLIFQFYVVRLVLKPEREKIAKQYPDYWRSEASRPRFGVRYSILVSSLILVLATLILAGIINYSLAGLAVIRQMGKGMYGEIKIISHHLKEMYSDTEVEGLEFSDIVPRGHFDGIYLMDREGRLVHNRGIELTPDIPSTVYQIWQGREEELRQEGVFTSFPEPDNRKWFAGLNRDGIYLAAYQTVPALDAILFTVTIWEKHKNVIYGIRTSIFLLTVFALMIAALIFTFSAYDLSRPIEEIRNLLRKVSGGDLSRELDLISESEVGDISVSLKQTVHSLRDMIGRVKGSAQVMEEKIVTIRESGSGVMKGIEVQQDDAQQTFSSIDGINSSIGEIGENLELLVSSIQEISSSIYEMDALIGEVAENIGSLSQSATETNVAITQIATSVNEIKEMGEKLSRRTREAVDSMEAMEGSTRKIGESARETAKLSDRVQEDAEVGFQAVVSTIEGIGKIRDSIRETARVIEGLGERIQEIGAVLVVIDEVTEETGLLSLNAAIIAAQAGEHGRGFAVVADQIKALAERTAVSTREISELIQRVQGESRDAVVRVKDGLERVEVGVRLAKESGEALSKIVGSSQRARQMIEDIVRATADQADRSQSFYNFIAETSQMLAETTRALREQSEGAMRITEASGRMQGIAEQIDRAAHEETSGSKQIIRAIEKVNEISKYINQAQKELADSSRRAGVGGGGEYQRGDFGEYAWSEPDPG